MTAVAANTERTVRASNAPTEPAGTSSAAAAVPRRQSRTCVGCGTATERDELLRCSYSDDVGIVVEIRGIGGRGKGAAKGSLGRGVWLHPRPECIAAAVKRGFARSLKRQVRTSVAQVNERLATAGLRRLSGLIQAARATRTLNFGRDAVSSRVEQTRLALLAEDAPRLLELPAVARLAHSGKLVIWGSKAQLGSWLGRGDVAILAIEDDGLATEVGQTLALVRLALASGEVQPQGQRDSMGKSVSEVR